MAKMLYLNDGSTEIITTEEDFLRFIGEKLGNDCSDYIQDIIDERDLRETTLESGGYKI